MAPLTLCTREIEKKMVQLQLRFKSISSRLEVAGISRYMSSLGVATEDYIKNEAMRSFIDSKSDAESLWREIDIFRMMDETSKFFIDDANVDLSTLCELQGAVQIWSHLVVAGGLDMVLARYPDIVMVRRRGGSPAEVFREYLSAHQLEGDFEIWDETRMNVFRLKLFELDQDLRLTKREDLSLVLTFTPDYPAEQGTRPDLVSGEFTAEMVEDPVATSNLSSLARSLPTVQPILPHVKEARIEIIDLTEDDIDIRGLPVKIEQVHEPEEDLYSSSPPPDCQTPTLVSPQASILPTPSVTATPTAREGTQPEPPVVANGASIMQLDPNPRNQELLGHPGQTNTQKLEAHLFECKERCQSTLTHAENTMNILKAYMQEHCPLGEETSYKLRLFIGKLSEELSSFDAEAFKTDIEAFTDFTISSREVILGLLDPWIAVLDACDVYVSTMMEKNKCERKVEIARSVGEAFGIESID
ncbi:hypothetical protein BKA61DRAFT_568451 [Leptodontidium sp. MPI-SDFR-AT-0119]|nr:hypothetical protein BKA61DRAFT_568451 [Leptodontidium sp. MPI-SDFR-AT-0119]